MKNNVQLSHVLYRVKDLHIAVKRLQDAGFIVEYGTDPDKAYNALIWFEKGVFIEIYNNSGLPVYVKWMMKIFGYQSVLERMRQWEKAEEGWCDWSLEPVMENLNSERQFFKNGNAGFRFHKAKRKDVNGNKLRWELLMPDDIDFPFLMSAYVPDPRPKAINHPNGIVGVRNIKIGTDNLNTAVLSQLLMNQQGLELIQGKGLQTVEFINSDLKIENILQFPIS